MKDSFIFPQHQSMMVLTNPYTDDPLFRPIRKGPPIIKDSKIGRNDNCPCDSGKKYKKCCL